MIIISQSLVVFIACMLSISNETLTLESALNKTKIEKNEADLNLLKAKINPHFLLNTLNNIYAINYEESPKTSEAIMQLSKVLSYTIYKSKNSLIVLSEEIELLESLIGLYQLKFDNQLRIQLTLNETVTQSLIEIPSLVLFSLLENAFKHSDLSENPKTYVNINLDLKGNKLIFEIINSVSLIKRHADANYFSGLGVDAIKQLLKQKYNSNFNFEIDKKNDSYKVTLIIYEL
ncbi:MAG: sensor histidine kinase [Bacteroidota bacterium]|nr:sensor histidine kinase [Bacteroidota bacterium]